MTSCSLIPVRSCCTGPNWQVLPGDRTSRSSLSLPFMLLSYSVYNSPTLFMHHLFFIFQMWWNVTTALNWIAQDINISYHCQATTRGCSKRLHLTPYSDRLLYFLQRSSLIRKGTGYELKFSRHSFQNPHDASYCVMLLKILEGNHILC